MHLPKYLFIFLIFFCWFIFIKCGDGPPETVQRPTSSDDSVIDTDDSDDGETDLKETSTIQPDTDDAVFSECDAARTCNQLEYPEDCIANFELGTAQAGFKDNYTNIGFYGYNDQSDDAAMEPIPNPNDSEPATEMQSCDPENDWVLHVKGSGFVEWGAGVGMDWGGPANPACDVDGALDCLQLGIDDSDFALTDAVADPACDTQEKLDCLTVGQNIKEMRDLSRYKGIGFWILREDEDSAAIIQVGFPIPDTVRFYGKCDEDDDDKTTNCFNDYATSVRLLSGELGKWVWKEVLFKDLKFNEFWGLQLESETFLQDQSVGIKFQINSDQGDFDFYLDDIVLLR